MFLSLCFEVTESLAQSVVHHLRWIMQKDLLGQDVFLIGPPGPLRRSIAMQYLVSVLETSLLMSVILRLGKWQKVVLENLTASYLGSN